MKHLLLPLVSVSALAGTATADVVFSEYIEGSSSNKALELQNIGSEAISNVSYRVELFSNGNTDPTDTNRYRSLDLVLTLEPGEVVVVANGNASFFNDAEHIKSNVTFFNGNDVLLLKKAVGTNFEVVDRLGQFGNGDDNFGANATWVRDAALATPDADYTAAFSWNSEWTEYPIDTFDYLGNDQGGSEPPAQMTCADPATLISEIQGSNAYSSMEGSIVEVEAIVVADLQASSEMRGFFIQEEDADQDGLAETSEGLFVYHSSDDVNVGDRVRLRAEVDEFYSLTQLTRVDELVICESNVALPTPASFGLPVGDNAEFEQVEGMQVSFADALTVNEVYNLGRYGEFLVANGRRFIPTDVAAPGPEADAIREANSRNALIVEDGIRYQNPDPLRFPTGGLTADNTLRVGQSVEQLVGVMNYAYGAYKLVPTSEPVFVDTNPRLAAPIAVEESDLRVASFNVLNFFNGDGFGGGFPTPRGADTAYELERQTAKLVSALVAMDADVIGLMELENDGFDAMSAVAELTAAVNAELLPEAHYQYVDAQVSTIGDDAIAVGLLYRPAVVSLLGEAAILSSANSPVDEMGEPLFIDSKNRPVLAQSFQHLDSETQFTVAVNHLKSKGPSNCEDFDDCDVGQGAYNKVRTKAAQALAQWLDSNPTGHVNGKTLILGDLNAYSKEDPLQALMSAGYSLVKPEGGYSYVFSGETGSLDHTLASAELLGSVIDVQDWHINTDEPRVLDYNTEYKSDEQINSLYAATPYRSSDHDPVIVDLAFNQAPEAELGVYPFFFWYIFVNESFDADGHIVDAVWQLGSYEVKGNWLFIPKPFIHRQGIREATLTVTDDAGASSSVTRKFR